MRAFLAALALLTVAACAERSITPVAGTTAAYAAHSKPIRLVRGPLPAGTQYDELGMVKAIEGFYGATAEAEKKIADSARAIGADAVINVKVWHAPRAFAWAAPHAEGMAVKLRQPDSVNLNALEGYTY